MKSRRLTDNVKRRREWERDASHEIFEWKRKEGRAPSSWARSWWLRLSSHCRPVVNTFSLVSLQMNTAIEATYNINVPQVVLLALTLGYHHTNPLLHVPHLDPRLCRRLFLLYFTHSSPSSFLYSFFPLPLLLLLLLVLRLLTVVIWFSHSHYIPPFFPFTLARPFTHSRPGPSIQNSHINLIISSVIRLADEERLRDGRRLPLPRVGNVPCLY